METEEILDNLEDVKDTMKRLDDYDVYEDGREWDSIVRAISEINRTIDVFSERNKQ